MDRQAVVRVVGYARDFIVWAFIGATILLGGCAVIHRGPNDWEAHPVSKAGEEVQTVTVENLGLRIAFSDAAAGGLPSIDVGRQKVTITRVPAFPADRTVPSVTATSTIDAATGAHVGDSLEVGTYTNEPEAAPGLWQRLTGAQ